MNKKLFFAILIIIIALWVGLCNIPITLVCPEVAYPEQISDLYVEFDTCEDIYSLYVTDQEEINEICSYFTGARLKFLGPYFSIDYNSDALEYPLIVIHFNNPQRRLYLKNDGHIFSNSTAYYTNSSNIKELYQHLKTMYFAVAT